MNIFKYYNSFRNCKKTNNQISKKFSSKISINNLNTTRNEVYSCASTSNKFSFCLILNNTACETRLVLTLLTFLNFTEFKKVKLLNAFQAS